MLSENVQRYFRETYGRETTLIPNGVAEPTRRPAQIIREKYGLRGRVDGSPESHWMIVDFGNVMVHVFTKEARELYQLETLWKDAPKVEAIRKLEAKIVASRLRS